MAEESSEVSKTPNQGELMPVRHPQMDLFLCDIADVVFKDIMQDMEHPFFSLSKKPDTVIREYEHKGKRIRVTPSIKGLATIYDKDILIYAISQLIAAMNRGEGISRRLRINSREFLIFANRTTGGKDYAAMVESIERLRGTTITTNILTGGEETDVVFGLIEGGTVRRKYGTNGRIQWVEITISEWLYRAIEGKEVLTLHPDYFRLRKPLERRIYELARKHCGHQPLWSVSVDTLLKKSGSRSLRKMFKHNLQKIANSNHLPDYTMEMDGDEVTFRPRPEMPKIQAEVEIGSLKSDTFEKARDVAPGYDVRFLETEWRTWSKETPKNPDAAFIGFCRRYFEKNGRP